MIQLPKSILPPDLAEILIESAKEQGFPLAGVVDIDLALSDPHQPFQKHLQHYDQWIAAGYAGSMEYLVRGRDRRADPRLLFPQAQSVLSVAIPYPRKGAGAAHEKEGPRYARYLQGPDYHLQIAEHLEVVMSRANERWKSAHSSPLPNQPGAKTRGLPRLDELSEPSLEWKICVDTSAVLERTWATLSGLGWIGKNTLLIHPQLGSYLFLAEVLINQKTGKAPQLLPNLCGNCRRCLDSCPTNAIERPGVLNSNRCIAYFTLEKRGELPLDSNTQSKMGTWVAGCDICQEACPFNLKPTRRELEEKQLKLPVNTQANPQDSQESSNATRLHHWRELLLETPEEYRLRVRHSAMKRVKPSQFSRNLAIALRNAFQHDSSEIAALGSLIQARMENETDSVARNEWEKCWQVLTRRTLHHKAQEGPFSHSETSIQQSVAL